MFLRVFKVSWFMFVCLLAFFWRRIMKSSNQDALLEYDYLEWSRYVLKTFQVNLSISGQEFIPVSGERRLVIMANHQSQLDIPSLVSTMNRRIGFVAKQELKRIPVLGYFMVKIGCIFIDRSDGRGASQVLEKTAKEMGTDPLTIFPEGTRSKDGGFLPIKQGGCRLAILADAIILPVLIQGTRNAGESRVVLSKALIPASLRFFPTLDTRDLGDGKGAYLKIKEYLEKCWQNPSVLT